MQQLQARSKRVVSFALWGANPLYALGAIRNAEMSPEFRPGWICRFYIDTTVTRETIDKLLDFPHVEIVKMHPAPDVLGMFWRFFPMFDDPTVERFVVRDTDCRPSKRETTAENEWIESGEPFHIMRDNVVHNTTILGGMWGAVAGCIPNMEDLIRNWLSNAKPRPQLAGAAGGLRYFHGCDQEFLNEVVWPLIIDKHIAHDEHYHYTGKERPFTVPLSEVGGHFVGDVRSAEE